MYIKNLKEDIAAVKERDPAARNALEIILCYPGFHAVRWHRRAHALYRLGLRLIPRMISSLNRHFTGVDIHPGAQIGKRLFIDHASGVVIGETAVIGDNVTIYQGATLGGTGKHTGKRHPTIEDDVMISAGAKILGPFTVGKGSRIGAGAVVLSEVPPYCTVVGVPGKIVRWHGQPGDDVVQQPSGTDLNQVDLPDPVNDEIAELKRRIAHLEGALHILLQQEEAQ